MNSYLDVAIEAAREAGAILVAELAGQCKSTTRASGYRDAGRQSI